MATEQSESHRDPIFEHFKQFVDRDALRDNLKLSVAERLENFQRRMDSLAANEPAGTKPDTPRWEAISDTGPDRINDPVVELFKTEIDPSILRANLRLSPKQHDAKVQELLEALRDQIESRRRHFQDTAELEVLLEERECGN